MEKLPSGPAAGEDLLVRIGDAMTARTLLGSGATDGNFAVVEHLLGPRALAAPLHMPSREDEHTVITEGRVGFLLGEEVYEAGRGELILKPRKQWHTFWNAGDEPARVLEIISPAGFEQYFQELGACFSENAPPDLAGIAAVAERYGLQMDMETMPEIIARFGLVPPSGPPRPGSL